MKKPNEAEKPKLPRGPRRAEDEIYASKLLSIAKMEHKRARTRADEAEEDLVAAIREHASGLEEPGHDPQDILGELIELRRAEFALAEKIKGGKTDAEL